MSHIILPNLGEGITEAEIVQWLAREGDRITMDDDLVELVTDKATFNVPAPSTGILTKMNFQSGDKVPVGATLGEIE